MEKKLIRRSKYVTGIVMRLVLWDMVKMGVKDCG